MKPEIYTLPAEDYHADYTGDVPSLSCSIAKILLNQTPKHAWLAHPRLNTDYEGGEEASRLDIGTACHAMLLEGIDSVVVCDYPDWRTKAAQEARDEARLMGKIPLLTHQYEDVVKMYAIATHAMGEAGFCNGKPEQTVVWQEGDTRCRARPDWLSNDHKLILDYKTTALPNPGAWMRAIPGNGYDVQDAFYRRGVEAVTGIRPGFVFMVQEVKPPYLCYFVELPAAYQEVGHQKVETAISKWAACMASGKWPGYPQGIMQPEPPAWAMAEAEELAAERQGWSVDAFLYGSVRDDKSKASTLEEFDK